MGSNPTGGARNFSMNAIKIYGLRRTGTNYLQWLLAQNFKQLVILKDMFAWKHGLPIDYKGKTYKFTGRDYCLSPDILRLDAISKLYYILCVKDPYSWYISICNWHNTDPFPLDKDKLERLFLWNYMGLEYIKFVCKVHSSVIIRYEDLLTNLDFVLQTMADRFCLFRMNTLLDTDCNIYDGTHIYDKRYFYASKHYLDLYSGTDFEMARKFLDKELVEKLGYRLL